MLDRLCRLCGTKDDNMMNIFNELNSTHKILFKIHKVLQINVSNTLSISIPIKYLSTFLLIYKK